MKKTNKKQEEEKEYECKVVDNRKTPNKTNGIIALVLTIVIVIFGCLFTFCLGTINIVGIVINTIAITGLIIAVFMGVKYILDEVI